MTVKKQVSRRFTFISLTNKERDENRAEKCYSTRTAHRYHHDFSDF